MSISKNIINPYIDFRYVNSLFSVRKILLFHAPLFMTWLCYTSATIQNEFKTQNVLQIWPWSNCLNKYAKRQTYHSPYTLWRLRTHTSQVTYFLNGLDVPINRLWWIKSSSIMPWKRPHIFDIFMVWRYYHAYDFCIHK